MPSRPEAILAETIEDYDEIVARQPSIRYRCTQRNHPRSNCRSAGDCRVRLKNRIDAIKHAISRVPRRKNSGPLVRSWAALLELYAFLRFLFSRKFACDKKFVLFGEARTGSSLLVTLLDSLHGVKCEGELWKDPLLAPRRFIHHHYALCSGQAFGFKILPPQAAKQQEHLGIENILSELADGGYKIVELSRDNLLRMALSTIRARSTGQWHRREWHSGRPIPSLAVNVTELFSVLREIQQLRREKQALLEGLPTLKIDYEKDLEDAAAHADTVRRIAEYLEIPYSPPETTLRRIQAAPLAETIANYDEIAAALIGTEFERFLD